MRLRVISVCVCTCICICICIFVSVYLCGFNECVYICECMHSIYRLECPQCEHLKLYILHIHSHIHTLTYSRVYKHIRVPIHQAHINTCTYTHTHAHSRINDLCTHTYIQTILHLCMQIYIHSQYKFFMNTLL